MLNRWELAPLLLLFLLASLKFGELVLQRWLRKVPTLSKSRREDSLPKVAIVGSGFAGLCLAIKLKLMGVPFVIYEKADSVGGGEVSKLSSPLLYLSALFNRFSFTLLMASPWLISFASSRLFSLSPLISLPLSSPCSLSL